MLGGLGRLAQLGERLVYTQEWTVGVATSAPPCRMVERRVMESGGSVQACTTKRVDNKSTTEAALGRASKQPSTSQPRTELAVLFASGRTSTTMLCERLVHFSHDRSSLGIEDLLVVAIVAPVDDPRDT
jgi:hypothetical protein